MICIDMYKHKHIHIQLVHICTHAHMQLLNKKKSEFDMEFMQKPIRIWYGIYSKTN